LKKLSTNARLLNQIDRYAGAFACFLLTTLRRLNRREEEYRKPNKIILLKLAEQGSTVLAYDAIQEAVKLVGPENVYFLLFEENRFILDLLDLIPVQNVLTIRTKSAATMVLSCIQRLWQIRRIPIDACVDMEFFMRSTAAIAYLTGTPIRIGFHAYFGEGPYRGDLMTHRLIYNPHIHTSDTFTNLIRALEFPAREFPAFPVKVSGDCVSLPPMIRFGSEERQEVEQLVNVESGNMEGPLILLNANASDLVPLRRWDEKNYVELAKRIITTFPNMRVAFTGSSDEVAKSERLVQSVQSPQCFSLSGKTTLRQLLIVYQMAEVLVTNDSGPAHFAVLTSIDVITLFGPETPLLFGARSPRNHSLWAEIACSPCINALNNRQSCCHNNVCMQMLSVDLVFETLCQIIRKRAGAWNKKVLARDQ